MCVRNRSSRVFLYKFVRNRGGRLRVSVSVCALSLAALLVSCAGAERPANKKLGKTSRSVYVFGTASFQVGNGGQIAAGADFNGDGRPDLVAINRQTNSVSILLGQKDGTMLDSGTSYPVGVQPQAIAVADFNGDGKADLAVLNFVCPPNTNLCPAGSVSILLGKGDGTFQAHVDFATGPAPVAIVAGDFNGDGKPDLAVTNHVNPIDSGSPGTFSILLGNGDGTFQTHTDHAAGSGVGTLVATDFNKDGKLDLVISNAPTATNSAVLLMLGNGDGSFQGPTALSISGAPVAFATGDFNGDGNADLAITTSASVVSVLLGNGNGSFQAQADYPVAPLPGNIIVADLNGDGSLDLIVAATGLSQEGFISVLVGHGDGTFQTHADYVEGSSDLVAVAVSEAGEPALGPRVVFPQGTGVAGRAVRDVAPVVTADALSDPRITLTPEMREQNHARTAITKTRDRRQRGANSRVVGDLPFRIQGHIEIDAHQSALAAQVCVAQITNRFFVHLPLVCHPERSEGSTMRRVDPSLRSG